MILLLVYDRTKGELVGETCYADSAIDEANQARLQTEITYAGQPGIEVVILQSASRKDLEKTHARYFKSLKELRPTG